jgi:DNA mismatch repair protein MutL
VVKELVENAVDAGAEEIEIEYEAGGIDLIEVRDDGEGIPSEDLPLAVRRHATSKIESADDLRTVRTLGFRGEALASIASVAQLTITSRTNDSTEAYELYFEEGDPQVKPAGRGQGTTVRVEELFGSVPARRKFLKTERTEQKHILREVRQKALAHPQIHFKLFERDDQVLNVPPGPLRNRVMETLGRDIGESMTEVERTEPDWKDIGEFRLTGLVSNGDVTHSNRRHQFNFVNSRGVRAPVIYRAISKSYERLGIREDHPPVVLFLELPPDQVDVNVHPRKEEVRFDDSQVVFRFVYESVKETLQDYFSKESSVDFGTASESNQTPSARSGEDSREENPPFQDDGADQEPESTRELQFDSETESKDSTVDRADRVLGQFRETFLVVEKDDGLYLFDQHTAHERILYEQYRDKIEEREPAQYLSVPLTLDLTANDREFLLEKSDQLENLGITIEDFGGGTLAVQSVPGYLGRRSDDKRMIYDMLEELLMLREKDVISDPADDLITIMACRSAVMRGDRLMPREQNELLESLNELDYPARCPHGRRIFYRIDNDTISDWFQRPKDDLCAR